MCKTTESKSKNYENKRASSWYSQKDFYKWMLIKFTCLILGLNFTAREIQKEKKLNTKGMKRAPRDASINSS